MEGYRWDRRGVRLFGGVMVVVVGRRGGSRGKWWQEVRGRYGAGRPGGVGGCYEGRTFEDGDGFGDGLGEESELGGEEGGGGELGLRWGFDFGRCGRGGGSGGLGLVWVGE